MKLEYIDAFHEVLSKNIDNFTAAIKSKIPAERRNALTKMATAHPIRVDRGWYKKYNFRLTFLYTNNPHASPSFMYNYRKNGLRDHLIQKGFDVVKRDLSYSTEFAIYGREESLMDYIISEPEISKYLIKVEFSSADYLEELEKLDGSIARELSFQQTVPEYRYIVHFGNYTKLWYDVNQIERCANLMEVIISNPDAYVPPLKKQYSYNPDTARVLQNYKTLKAKATRLKWSQSKFLETVKQNYPDYLLYNGTIALKDPDDITMLHLCAAGNIKKVVKIVKKSSNREKNEEPISANTSREGVTEPGV